MPRNREKDLETLLTICVGLSVIFYLTHRQHDWLLISSIVVGVIALFFQRLASFIAQAWMKVGELMGAVSSKVILTLIFFLFLIPIAALAKIFSRNRQHLQLKKSSDNTYYIPRQGAYKAEDLAKPW